jgi:hypothetical protein
MMQSRIARRLQRVPPFSLSIKSYRRVPAPKRSAERLETRRSRNVENPLARGRSAKRHAERHAAHAPTNALTSGADTPISATRSG